MTSPQIEVSLPSGPPFFGSARTAPVTLDVVVANTSAIPFHVRRIELSSPSATEFGIYPTERLFNQLIAPGEQQTLALTATAVTSQSSRMAPTEPLMLRVIVEMEHEGKRWREVILSRGLS